MQRDAAEQLSGTDVALGGLGASCSRLVSEAEGQLPHVSSLSALTS